MTIFLISLALLILVSGYFFISDYFEIFNKTSDPKPVTNPESAAQDNTPIKETKRKKSKVIKNPKTETKPEKKGYKSKLSKKESPVIETKPEKKGSKSKLSKKESLRTPENQRLNAKRGRKKNS